MARSGGKQVVRTERSQQILDAVMNQSRQPFLETLATFLGAEPTETAIKKFANQHPDRWASAVTLFAKLSGFEDAPVIQNNTVIVQNMSDAELYRELQRARAQTGAVIDKVKQLAASASSGSGQEGA